MDDVQCEVNIETFQYSVLLTLCGIENAPSLTSLRM